MNSEWVETTLGDVSNWASGGTPKKDVYEYWSGSIPWISASSMHTSRYSDSGLKVTELGLRNGTRLALKETVLLLVRGSALHDRIPLGIATRDVAFNQDVKAISAKRDLVQPWYLLYWLMGQEEFLLDSVVEFTGIGAGKLDTARMQSLPMLLPPLYEQDRIVSAIKSIDDQIYLLRETNETLEAIAQAIFKSWFVDFDPVKAKAEGRVPDGIDSETAALFPDSFDDSIDGAIPSGWSQGTLRDIAYLSSEAWSAKKHLETLSYLDLSDVKSNQINKPTDYSFEEAPSRARRVLRHGDTIFGTVRPGNRSYAFIANPVLNLTASTGFAVLRPNDPADKEFVYLAATQESSIDHLAHIADGGAYPAVRPEAVAMLPCVVADRQIMSAFHGFCDPMLSAISNNQEEIKTLTDLRDTLLPRLISGKLKLPESEQTAQSL